MKVKIFGGYHPDDAEKAINKWLEEMGNNIKIREVLQTSHVGSTGHYITITIFYVPAFL